MPSKLRHILVLWLAIDAVFVCGEYKDENLRKDSDFPNDIANVAVWRKGKKNWKGIGRQYNNPPPPEQGAKMARYIVHNSEWASLGSISSLSKIKGYPFTDVFSISDGTLLNSTGVPYLYMTPLDLSSKNIERDNRCSLSLSLAQSNYCQKNNLDPEDPRCAHVVLTGKMLKVKKGSEEEEIARSSLFSRHPAMKNWPKDHNWFFAKLKIESICLLDYFGGPKYISVDDYFNVKI
ncbi:hypothetical protein J437_LFUL011447 [Ladona fulva]|uniref:CREG-like beta-barrel domain-containing protein n=1 Tax=Ladona fulva TaxID=123851 RepID=A0A8K0P231_LADFU|nr:hypothetical protein J437_LFUL011447 [Ladona fulva]